LKTLVGIIVFTVPSLFNDRCVGTDETFTYSPDKCKGTGKTGLVEIVEKQTSYSPGFISVFQEKILIATQLKPFIIIRVKFVASSLGYLMPVPAVFVKSVTGSQVIPTAKPPLRQTDFAGAAPTKPQWPGMVFLKFSTWMLWLNPAGCLPGYLKN
jgi:hypothetical protein